MWPERLWPAWFAAVVFLYSVPHTVALRNLLLLLGFLGIVVLRGDGVPRFPPRLAAAALAMTVLTAWLLLQAFFVPAAPAVTLGNVWSDWLVPLLTAMLAAWCAVRLPRGRSLQAVLAGLGLTVALAVLYQGGLWLFGGMWPLGQVPYGQRDFQSAVSVFLLSLLVAERLAVALGQDSPLGLSRITGWVLFLAAAVADLLLLTRNGTLVFVALVAVAGLLYWRIRERLGIKALLLMLAVPLLVVTGSLLSDARWSGFAESYRVGWTSESNYWLSNDPADRPLPSSGAPLEESAYMRAAWAHQAVIAIGEHPLGLGFGRDAFGRAVALKHGHAGMVSSHSGWLDFAVGAGLPGLALLLLTGALAMRGGWRQFRDQHDAAGLMFGFLVGGYLLRCLLDGHLSGWRLGLFAFLCGVLVAAMKDGRRS
jgi:hypothetical protein